MNEEFTGELVFGAMLALLIASLFGFALGVGMLIIGYTMGPFLSMVVGGVITLVSLSGATFSYFWFVEPVEE